MAYEALVTVESLITAGTLDRCLGISCPNLVLRRSILKAINSSFRVRWTRISRISIIMLNRLPDWLMRILFIMSHQHMTSNIWTFEVMFTTRSRSTYWTDVSLNSFMMIEAMIYQLSCCQFRHWTTGTVIKDLRLTSRRRLSGRYCRTNWLICRCLCLHLILLFVEFWLLYCLLLLLKLRNNCRIFLF